MIGLVASIAIVQFTYSFPPLLRFGYDVVTDAMIADEPYVPGKGSSGRVDDWGQWSRWKRVSCLPSSVGCLGSGLTMISPSPSRVYSAENFTSNYSIF
jgi:hypothetical protein